MKNLINITKLSFLFLLLAISIVRCVKKDDYYKKDSTESNRKQVVQIIGAGDIVQYARDVKTTNDTFVLIDIRRYPNTEADLNQPLTVKLVKNPALIAAYDSANSTGFIELPANSYTLLTDINSVTFGAGEAIKEIKISVNQSLLDLSEAYALGFSIADAGTGAVINTSLKDALYNIGIKNKYDGDYSMGITTIGWSAYGISDNLPGTWPSNIGLVTSGAASVIIYDYFRGDNLQPAFTTGNASATAFGATAPQFTFDPVTDKLININNIIPDDGRGRTLHLNPAYTTSRYDAVTKTIYAYYIMTQNGRPDQQINVVLKYVGPR
jgi:hypothetical protein